MDELEEISIKGGYNGGNSKLSTYIKAMANLAHAKSNKTPPHWDKFGSPEDIQWWLPIFNKFITNEDILNVKIITANEFKTLKEGQVAIYEGQEDPNSHRYARFFMLRSPQ